MYAIIKTGGKQVQVELGSKICIEKVNAPVGEHYQFDNVLLVSDGEQTQIGTPYVDDCPVVAKVLDHGRGEKIRVIKMKRRKNYRRTQGHRQSFTELEVVSIGNLSSAGEPEATHTESTSVTAEDQ